MIHGESPLRFNSSPFLPNLAKFICKNWGSKNKYTWLRTNLEPIRSTNYGEWHTYKNNGATLQTRQKQVLPLFDTPIGKKLCFRTSKAPAFICERRCETSKLHHPRRRQQVFAAILLPRNTPIRPPKISGSLQLPTLLGPLRPTSNSVWDDALSLPSSTWPFLAFGQNSAFEGHSKVRAKSTPNTAGIFLDSFPQEMTIRFKARPSNALKIPKSSTEDLQRAPATKPVRKKRSVTDHPTTPDGNPTLSKPKGNRNTFYQEVFTANTTF